VPKRPFNSILSVVILLPHCHPRSPLRARLNRECSSNHREHRTVQRESLPTSLFRLLGLYSNAIILNDDHDSIFRFHFDAQVQRAIRFLRAAVARRVADGALRRELKGHVNVGPNAVSVAFLFSILGRRIQLE